MSTVYNTPEEELLISACKKGDQDAFEELIKKYERLVYSTVKAKVGSDSDALDVSQEVFIKIWRHIERYRGDCRFSTWVYKISVNATLDFLRKSKAPRSEIIAPRTDEYADESIAEIADERTPTPELYAEKMEQIRTVRDAIASLSPDQREVLTLRDIEGLSYEEISEMLSLEIGTVKSRINRARGNLRSLLLSKGADKLI